MIRLALGIATILLVTSWLFFSEEADNDIQLVEHEISFAEGENLRLALLSDFHFSDDPDSFDYLDLLIKQVSDEKPDLIALTGDYIATRNNNPQELISQIVSRLSAFQKIAPTFAVLGNHDNLSGRLTWIEEFEASPITLIENKHHLFRGKTCLRGLGDYSSRYYSVNHWPSGCDKTLKITLTHDPFAGFVDKSDGLVLAGHTHCGQVRFPIIGAPWTPSNVPAEARCGLFSNEHMILMVTGGLNTSILPIRLDTKPHWNLLIIEAG